MAISSMITVQQNPTIQKFTGVNGHEATYDDLMGIYNISNHSNTGNMIGVDDYSKDTSNNTRNMTGGMTIATTHPETQAK